jgi:hypothetical protein
LLADTALVESAAAAESLSKKSHKFSAKVKFNRLYSHQTLIFNVGLRLF